jgi:hypothetical protein
MDCIERSTAILHSLEECKLNEPEIPLDPAENPQEDYRILGTFFGAPKVRRRPFYSDLEKQDNEEAFDRNADRLCQKFYDTFQRKTGGICVFWCPHGVAVGFHLIPTGEGRNDVFSAIYCHWQNAPKVLVYDFACQLHPYNIRREPLYWKDTLHLIDQFHYEGHKRCASTYNIKSYRENNPSLAVLDTTCAEVGNSALRRLRKSVSYMLQTHMMAFVRSFLDIWNRKKVINLIKRAPRMFYV